MSGQVEFVSTGDENENAGNYFPALEKIWRQPTLAQAIQALPSARLCLTAEFGMGSGRTTALWPPRNVLVRCHWSVVEPANGHTPNVKDHRLFDTDSAAHSTDHGPLTTNQPRSLKTTHSKGVTV